MNEDACRAKKGNSPQNLAAFRNLGLSLMRLSGIKEIKSTIRTFSMKPYEMLKTLRILKNVLPWELDTKSQRDGRIEAQG